MELATLQKLLSEPENSQQLYAAFRSEYTSRYNQIDYFNFDPRTHRIMIDRWYRPDKIVNKPIPNEFDDQNRQRTGMHIIPVSRIAVPFQQEIVESAVSFAVGGKIKLDATPKNPLEETLFDEIQNQWNINKIQYKMTDIATRMFSETEAAVLFFSDKDSDGVVRMRMRVLSPSTGDTLYPIFNGNGNMIAFGVDYIGENDTINFDVYTDSTLFRFQQDSGLKLMQAIPLQYGKIPIIYFNQILSEWNKVQTAIDRFELSLSNLCDTNDYNGSPIMFAEGEITGFADKGESGKLITGANGAKLTYLTWDKAPESIKLEFDTLVDIIHSKTRTIDLSPSGLKGLGDIPSGAAFDRILISAHMKAADKQNGMLGEGVQRIVNFLKSAVVNFLNIQTAGAKRLYVEPKFSLFRIDDLDDRIQSMSSALPGQQLVSRNAAVAYIGITNDADAEVQAIADEQPKPLDVIGNQ